MGLLLFLDEIETRFTPDTSIKWMEKYWMLSICASVLYVILVLTGYHWMKAKSAYELRPALMAWNTGLAVFSALGFIITLRPLIDSIQKGGMGLSVCWTPVFSEPQLCLWSLLFAMSKFFEFGDTAFVVLRKTPLMFLHVYHHVTVFIQVTFVYQKMTPIFHWCMTMNLFVHWIMYSYYAAKSYGFRVPSKIAQCITVLQLTQFLIGIYCNILAIYVKTTGGDCVIHMDVIFFNVFFYFSFVVLFLNFFYNRYIKKKRL